MKLVRYVGEIRILGTHNSRVGLLMMSLIMLSHIVKTDIDVAVKHLGARDYGVKGTAGFYRHRIILRMQKMVGEHPSFLHDCCVDFLKGDVSVLEDSMERFAAVWSSSAFDDLRHGDDKAADVLEHAIQHAADKIESDDSQLLKPSDVRVLVAVAEPKFSEFLVGRCTDKLELAHWEGVQERCDATAIKYQPSLSELHTAAADCLMIVTLGQVATACINIAYADAPTMHRGCWFGPRCTSVGPFL